MSLLYKASLSLCYCVLLVSCGTEDDYSAYFGGQVINPRANYLVFSKENKVIDTLRLDKSNRFFIKFDSLTPGLYTFKHEQDYQYVYFDRNDSIMVSLNPEDFDQSIIFSGRGDSKNNFMMELSLMHEADRKNGYDIYDYDYEKFRRSADSAFAQRKAFYEKSKAEIKWSEDFDYYALARTNLNYFTKKEYYPYVHARRTGKNIRPSLPKDFYSFREKMDFNDPRLIYYSPYVRYLTALINNMAITDGFSGTNVQEDQLRDNLRKLDIADSLFSNEQVKNEMLNNIAFSYLLEDQNIINNRTFLQRYMKLSTDDDEDNEIWRIGEAIKLLDKGSRLPVAKLKGRDGKPVNLSSGRGKETVVFFWTSCARAQLESFYNRVKSLRAAHPNVDFVAVNVDSRAEWNKRLAMFDNLDVLQLRAENFNEIKDKWVVTKITRTIILNPDGTIKNAFTNLMDPHFEGELK